MKKNLLLKMNSELWLFLHFTSWMLILSLFFFVFFFFCSFSFKYLNVTHQFWILTLNTYLGKEAGGSVGGWGEEEEEEEEEGG